MEPALNFSIVKSLPLKQKNHLSPIPSPDHAVKLIIPIIQKLSGYHQHEVVGLEHLPQKGGFLVAVNHSLATYDIGLLMLAIYQNQKRIPRPLLDRLFFKIPLLREAVTALGGIEGTPDRARQLLDQGEIVTVAPGGMFEALRPSSEKYQIRWSKRYGFARLAMTSGKPIVLAACPKADDMFNVYPSHLTSWFYQTYKVPIFLARGLGPTPIPRPVKLVHHMSPPIQPPPMPEDRHAQESAIRTFHAQLVDTMEHLMKEAQKSSTKPLSRPRKSRSRTSSREQL